MGFVLAAFLAVSGFGGNGFAQELTKDRVLDPARVIEISIEIPKKDWAELCKQNRDPGKVFQGVIENPFTYFKGDITIDGVTIKSVGIRKKGFIGSLDNRFPSLKISFDEYEKQEPIKGLQALTLNNNKQDSALVSQYLSYQLFNAAGVKAPRCSFVRVKVNGEYLGVYSNVETIDKPYLKDHFGNDGGNLYEGTLADFHPKALDRIEIKTNKKKHDLSKVTKLAEVLGSEGSLKIDEVEKLVDVDNFLRFWTMESLISFWDGYTNNQNNYWVYENLENGKLYFMPWGADMAYQQSPFFTPFGPSQPVSVYGQGILANRLYQEPALAERYRETMRWQLANVWKEAELMKTIDQVETLLKPHLHARQSGAPRAMKSMRQFIEGRRAKIEKELEKWPATIPGEPRKPMYHVAVGTAKGSFVTTFAENAPGKIADQGEAKLALTMDGKEVELKKSGASLHKPRGGMFFGFGGPAQDARPTVELVIASAKESDGKAVSVTVSVDAEKLAESLGKPMEVRGSYSGGEPSQGGFMPMPGKSVKGTVTFTKAGAKAGDAVEGEFELVVSELHGGFFGPPAPPRRAAPSGANE